MRKKNQSVVSVGGAIKTIQKPSRTPPTSKKNTPKDTKQCQPKQDEQDPSDPLQPPSHGLLPPMDLESNPSCTSSERTPPCECDILRYLSTNIRPPDVIQVTSFVIGVDEYLQGVVQLIQRDCPEMAPGVHVFTAAIQKAFIDVNGGSPAIV
jgi:hypothetical protein